MKCMSQTLTYWEFNDAQNNESAVIVLKGTNGTAGRRPIGIGGCGRFDQNALTGITIPFSAVQPMVSAKYCQENACAAPLVGIRIKSTPIPLSTKIV